jgi:acyl-CoA dehydrogenase
MSSIPFRNSVREFIRTTFLPQQNRWREHRRPDVESWMDAGLAGLLLPGSIANEVVVIEELARAAITFGCLNQEIVARYVQAYATADQKLDWLPRMKRGELVGAIAMTEPSTGSDLQSITTTAQRDGDHYVINGAKAFITNGWHAGLVCVAVRTGPVSAGIRALSLLMVETKGLQGYSVGRPLDKAGMQGQDTCDLVFENVRVPAANLLGLSEGSGFLQMMEQLPYERLMIGVCAVATSEEAVRQTVEYVKQRKAFGKPLIDFQNTRFKLAECATEARLGRVFIDDCIRRFEAGRLDGGTAAMAKYFLTERQGQIVDQCVQLHGGYGYMADHPIARMWLDSRVQRIYAGSNEIMKEVIASSL